MGRVLSDAAPLPEDEAARRALDKQGRLEAILAEMGSVLVALSGGVDSAFLAAVAHRTLGERMLAVTGVSPSYSAYQKRLAERLVAELGLPHRFVATKEMEQEAYRRNEPDRCYHCKDELYGRLVRIAREEGYAFVVDGSNADDRADFRPGREAARRHGVRSPLDEADLAKREIRYLSRRLGLPTADEPASACLSSRIPYRTPITAERLRSVERGEDALRALGFRRFRVRHHERLVRLEFAREELDRALAPEMRGRLVEVFKGLGYAFVTVDLEGYRTGSLNETLDRTVELPVV